jgi:hypothetical protein
MLKDTFGFLKIGCKNVIFVLTITPILCPEVGYSALRMPFERSNELRKETLQKGTLEVERRVFELLQAL